MKLQKVKNDRCGGYDIYLIIANRKYHSYWSSPPDKIDHVGLGYLKDRYPKINTQKRMNEFKELYKNLWIEVTDYQLELMQHCIGISKKKNKPYRNYFFTNCDDKDWNELIFKGLAKKSNKEPDSHGCIYFWLSKQGVEFILNKTISEEFYKEL